MVEGFESLLAKLPLLHARAQISIALLGTLVVNGTDCTTSGAPIAGGAKDANQSNDFDKFVGRGSPNFLHATASKA